MSDSNVFFINSHKALLSMGIEVSAIYARLGIDQEVFMRAGFRHAHKDQIRYWNAVEEVTGDKEIGLHLCPHISPFAGEVLIHLLVSSPTLGIGLQRFQRYVRLLSDDLNFTLATALPGDEAALIGVLGGENTPRHSEITFFYGMLQAIRYGAAGMFSVSRVQLRCAAGQNPEEFERVFGCPVTFGAAETGCYFHHSLLSLPLPHADPEMAQAHEAMAQRRIRKMLKYDLVQEVRSRIQAHLEDGEYSLEAVAAELQRKPRSLGKELLDAGTSFKQLVVEARQAVAKRLLAHSDEPIERIAVLVGLSERSAFYRAFKSWTGLTPKQYRERR